MDTKNDTTRSMEIRANKLKRLAINLMKIFRICCQKKHPPAPGDVKKA